MAPTTAEPTLVATDQARTDLKKARSSLIPRLIQESPSHVGRACSTRRSQKEHRNTPPWARRAESPESGDTEISVDVLAKALIDRPTLSATSLRLRGARRCVRAG